MIVSSAATMVRSNAQLKTANSPTVTITSCSSEITAPTPNCHSNRSQT